MATCWINGDIVAPEKAQVSVFDHGLLYGDGVFEGLRFYAGRVFRIEQHIDRLYDSADAIALSIPYDRNEIVAAIQQLVQASRLDDGYIRLVVTRGEGSLGLDPDHCQRATVFMIADHLSLVPDSVRTKGLRVMVASVRRTPNDSLDSRIKSLNYLNHILARLEAKAAGVDEAILLNHAGCVAEASTENVFIVKNECLLTPPVGDGALQGITRQAIMELAQPHMEVREQSLTPYDLYTADECFLSGTGAELMPVRQVDTRTLRVCPGPVYSKLQTLYSQLVYREDKTEFRANAGHMESRANG